MSSTGKLGGDLGYGFGWHLQAGSVTPHFSDWWNVHHCMYPDATGPQYRMGQLRAGTLIHELGHVFANYFGTSSTAIGDDSASEDLGRQSRERALSDCFNWRPL